MVQISAPVRYILRARKERKLYMWTLVLCKNVKEPVHVYSPVAGSRRGREATVHNPLYSRHTHNYTMES